MGRLLAPVRLPAVPLLPTFRDPAGSIEIRPDGAYRRIRAPFDAEILSFLSLPLASELVADGRLVASEVVTPSAESLILRHPRDSGSPRRSLRLIYAAIW